MHGVVHGPHTVALAAKPAETEEDAYDTMDAAHVEQRVTRALGPRSHVPPVLRVHGVLHVLPYLQVARCAAVHAVHAVHVAHEAVEDQIGRGALKHAC